MGPPPDVLLSDTMRSPDAPAREVRGCEPVAGSTVGRFFLMAQLGAGGMGVVWAAYDPQLDRRIALKFVRPDTAGASPQEALARLMREAQALARVNHPNVIAIHDVGTGGELIYIAEEFVHGADLARWLAAQPRSLDELLGVFLQAGHGLAAAHRAGVVHRDFKPANVLVGDDGRVRVVDFGLARALDDPGPGGSGDAAAPAAAGGLASSLTVSGTVMGTPMYMAPEQHLGQRVDERSDQFSFCLSLYEALYGEGPFAGGSRAELMQAVLRGQVREPPRGSRVPAWLRAVLLRGLSVERDRRFESMETLLTALARDPRRSRRRALGAATALALAAAVLVASGLGAQHYARSRLLVCQGAQLRLAGVWDDARKAQIQQAFAATGRPYAAASWRSVERHLDAYARDWAAGHAEACAATRLRGEQSEEVLDLRMSCLSQRLKELQSLAEVFTTADKSVVDRAVQAASELSPLAECADAAALKAPLPPPRDLATREKVEAARAEVARSKALEIAGRYEEGRRTAESALALARATGYRPAEAEAMGLLGFLQWRLGKNAESAKSLEEAFVLSASARHEAAAAEAAIGLVRVLGSSLARYDEAHRWGRLAQAFLDRTPNDDSEARLADSLGALLGAEARWDEALVQYQRSLALDVKVLGPDHSRVGTSRNNIAVILSQQGRYDEALPEYRRALAIQEATLGPEHPAVIAPLMNIANILHEQGNNAEALPGYRRALSILEKVSGPDNPDAASIVEAIGDTLSAQGHYEEAVSSHRRALALREKALGPDHPDVAMSLANLGVVLFLEGRYRESLESAARALAIDEKTQGPDHPDTAWALAVYGQALYGLGRNDEAIPRLEHSLAILARSPAPDMDASVRFSLARALSAARRDRPRALELARKAREEYAGLHSRQKELAEIDLWLAERGAAK